MTEYNIFMKYYGIYRITNLVNGKIYIGQHTTTDINDGYMGSGLLLKRAINKYGKENFRKDWLMFCEDAEELNYMEMVYVNQDFVDRSDTYNLTIGGGNVLMSEEHKSKISTFQKEYKNRPEVRKYFSSLMKVRMSDPQERLRISLATKNAMSRPDVQEKVRLSHQKFKRNKPPKQYQHIGKEVVQFDSDYRYIKTWYNCIEAMRETGFSSIKHACQNCGLAGGFRWFYKEDIQYFF